MTNWEYAGSAGISLSEAGFRALRAQFIYPGESAVKTLLTLAIACTVGLTTIGCGESPKAERKVETTVTTPGGETKTTVDQKVETTPDSATRTTTEKVEKTGDNPPPAAKP